MFLIEGWEKGREKGAETNSRILSLELFAVMQQ
jgi:hypothetical protein